MQANAELESAYKSSIYKRREAGTIMID
jgi:hypothetical protein